MGNAVRFVTPEEFASVLDVVNAATPRDFPPWFPLVLRALFATGCRPAEIVGTSGRVGREEEEGGPRVSRVKPHHGLRPRDVLANYRLYIEGKHTTPKGRTTDLKPRIVLCADEDLWRDLRDLAARRMASHPEENLFLPPMRDGKEMLRDQFEKLQRRLPTNLKDFSPRWLRHSHAIAAIRAGIDLVSIQRQLGHESLTTTAIYLRFAGLDEMRYLSAFGGPGARTEKRDCPSCGFTWRVDKATNALDLGSRMGAVFRR